MTSVLLLNAGFEPLRIVTWRRAFILLFQGKVDILEEYTAVVRTVTRHYKVPAVIRLRRWVNLHRQPPIIRFSRANVYARDENLCQYCRLRVPERDLTLDHVIPVVRGGRKNWENIVAACKGCNQKKGDRTPEEARMPLRKRPRAPRWLPRMVGTVRTTQPPDSWEPYLGLYNSALLTRKGLSPNI